ncbi:MAG: hypothetical protein H0W11_14780, partial [Gemmatimonadetes bacterium]|nr:hypothetical protein [Gemmatimonadota bacterium]
FVLGALPPPSATSTTTRTPRPQCNECGADLYLVGFLRARGRARGSALFDTS